MGVVVLFQFLKEGNFGRRVLGLFAMMLFGYALTTGVFKSESLSAQNKLAQIMAAK